MRRTESLILRPSPSTSALARLSTGTMKCGTPEFTKSPSSPFGSGIHTLTWLSSRISASTRPAAVSKHITLPFAAPISRAKAATHRAPLPHSSASEPSGLKNLIEKSAREDFPTRITPSQPTPIRRAAIAAIRRPSQGKEPSRSSTMTKSLPAPCIFVNFIFISTTILSAAVTPRRASFARCP